MVKEEKKGLPVALIIVILLVVVYAFPRLLISQLGPSDPWTSYLYQYGFGAIVFVIGINLILKSGSCNLKRQNDRFWFKWIIAGFFFFAILHLVWILLAINIPVKGAM